jgi:hypothetical protein
MNNKKAIERGKLGTYVDIIKLLDRLSFIPRLSYRLKVIEESCNVETASPRELEEMYEKVMTVQKSLFGELKIREEYHGLTYPDSKKNE